MDASAGGPTGHGSGAAGHEGGAGFGALLVFAMCVATLPQFTLGVLAPMLVRDLRISEGQVGLAASALFTSAVVVARFGGVAIDAFGGRRMLVVMFTATGVGFGVFASATSFAWLVAAAMLAGIPSGLSNPATNKLIVVYAHPSRHGLLVGIKQAGVNLAQALAGFGLVPLAVLLGWRIALTLGIAAAGAGIASALRLPALRVDRTTNRSFANRSDLRRRLAWLRRYAFFMAMGLSAFTTFFPLYAVQRHGFSLAAAGFATGSAGLVAAVARIGWSYLSRLWGTSAQWLAVLSCGSVACFAVMALDVGFATPFIWASAIGVGLTAGTWTVVAHLTVIRDNDQSEAARASALLQASFVLGLAAGAPSLGLVLSSTGSYPLGWGLVTCIATAATVVALAEVARSRKAPGPRLPAAPQR